MLEISSILATAFIFVIITIAWLFYKIGLWKGLYSKDSEWQSKLQKMKYDIAQKQRVGIKGQVAETFAPFLWNFPFKPSECKFLGDPIDYIVFEGLDERDIKKIHLVEVKTDKSKMSKHQKQIKDLVDKIGTDKIEFHNFDFKSEDKRKEGFFED